MPTFTTEEKYDMDASGPSHIAIFNNGDEITRATWNGSNVIFSERTTVLSVPIDNFLILADEFFSWQSEITKKYKVYLESHGNFKYEIKKGVNKELSGTIGGNNFSAEIENGNVVIPARPQFTFTFSDFHLFLSVHKRFIVEII